jgi:hypothetical protein
MGADGATPGELTKFRVEAHDKPDYSDKAVETYEAYVNPAEVTVAFEVDYNSSQGSGTTDSRKEFHKVKPADLTINFFIDGTGANGNKVSVKSEIDKFNKVTGYDGKIHRTRYLLVAYGDMEIKRCVLKSTSVVYKLFKPNGIPLRAVITAVFTGNADDQTRVAAAKDESPDLTHVRVVTAGDTLPGLCYKIYEDTRYYLDVAQANGLDDFRNLVPGTRIFFPPLEK